MDWVGRQIYSGRRYSLDWGAIAIISKGINTKETVVEYRFVQNIIEMVGFKLFLFNQLF